MEEGVEVVGGDEPCPDDVDGGELAGTYPTSDRGFGRHVGLNNAIGNDN
jgi:hypothetical protein